MNNSNLTITRNLTQVVIGEQKSRCVYIATRPGLVDLIESGTDNDGTLAATVSSDTECVHRLMRLLVVFEILQGGTHDGYANTPTSHLLRSVEGSFYDMVLFYGGEFRAAWAPACKVLLSDTPGSELAFGGDFYSYLRRYPDADRRFLPAMKADSLAFHETPRLLDFRGRGFVSVGGGSGELTKATLQVEPSAQGMMFDRKGPLGVIHDNPSNLLAGKRVSLMSDDMLQEVPSNDDIYLPLRVIGDLDETASLKLLGNRREAMVGNDRVMMIERAISTDKPSPIPVFRDTHLFMVCADRHHTTEEMIDLLGRGGFTVEWIVDLPMKIRMIVTTKA